ncbi:hypothetical protein SAMN05660297_03427 [Natronincola peptidivorans]|uniref:Uncharacterized protein n=1 Tax=Natronincola peptidivorans TaxID=426128 RepID=A0A1I0H0X4_9FIRM|nr:hypothetical protein [Natronincola peptidivorans]SET76451.1 hypothetical protein SAMN05660297_03427 [Natronincola peptidivorans]
MKKKNSFENEQLDTRIKGFFSEAAGDVKIEADFKKKLLKIPEEQKPLSPFSRFLEKEICIPVFSLPAFAAILLLLVGISANNLLLPGDLPQPKYEIIEISHDELNMHLSNRY